MAQRYIKQVDNKWYDVHVEFGEDNIGRVTEVFITDEQPEFDIRDALYIQQ